VRARSGQRAHHQSSELGGIDPSQLESFDGGALAAQNSKEKVQGGCLRGGKARGNLLTGPFDGGWIRAGIDADLSNQDFNRCRCDTALGEQARRASTRAQHAKQDVHRTHATPSALGQSTRLDHGGPMIRANMNIQVGLKPGDRVQGSLRSS
jgi:hypothetical protein